MSNRPTGTRLADYRFELPSELIAQAPLASRSASRLLVLEGDTRAHRRFDELPDLLAPGDHLIFNDTRVIPARLYGRKASGGRVELMLERFLEDGRSLVKLRASKSPKPGTRLVFETDAGTDDFSRASGGGRAESQPPVDDSEVGRTSQQLVLEVVGRRDDLFEVVDTGVDNTLASFLEAYGEMPLPPYIERSPDARDAERYQTVYSRRPGAVAAPTAGLHFDEGILDALARRGVTHDFVTLHVGAGTFQPVRVENPAEHVMHAERLLVSARTVETIEQVRAKGGRIIAVGTTSVRALESAAQANGGRLAPHAGETRLFLTPGSTFHVVDGLVTNFHLPESTLLMLIAAFAGYTQTMAAYREAVAERYRFFSYGDAMLVFPTTLTVAPSP